MANSDKNIRIQPNRNSTLFPKITFTGQNNNPITLNVLDDNSLSFEGSSGQLFSINNNLSSGYIFSVNDISGLPSFRINADGTVGIAEFYGNVGIGITNPSFKLQVAGSASIGGSFTLSGDLKISSSTASTTTTTGALTVTGGVGIGGSMFLGGVVNILSNVESNSTSTGSLVVRGGIAGTGGLYVKPFSLSTKGIVVQANPTQTGNLLEIQDSASSPLSFFNSAGELNINSSTASTSTTTGALKVTGGVGIGGSLYVGSTIVTGSGTSGLSFQPQVGSYTGAIYSTNITPNTNNFSFITDGSSAILNGTYGVYLNISNNNKLAVTTNNINIGVATGSTSTTTGALTVSGGVGIGGTLNVNNIGIGYTGIPYNPSIAFIGTTGDPIKLNVLSNNTLSFEGRSGQLFSINNNLSTGWIYSVNDISGIPLFRANANANIAMAEFAGNVGIGTSNPLYKFQVNGNALIASSIASTAVDNGALTVTGGVGIGQSLNIGNDVIINGGRESNSTSTGSLIVRGGVGITGGLYVKPFSLSTKGLVVQANTSQTGNLFELQSSASSTLTSFNANGDLNITSSTANTSTTTGSIVTAGGVGIGGSVTIGSTSPSISTTTGALKVAGGVGIAGTVNVGGSLNFSQSIFGGVGTITNPQMTFVGQANDPITLSVLPDNSLSFDGSSGQLFSINNNLSTGWIFSISDISGLPLFRTNADGTVAMGEYGGNVGIGLTNPSYKLQVNGNSGIANTLFVSGRAHIGNTTFTDIYAGLYSPVITLSDNFDGDTMLQIENKSDGVNARSGILFVNGTSSVAGLYLSGQNYGGAGLGFSEIRLYGSYPFAIETKSTSISANSVQALTINSSKVIVDHTAESTSSTTGSLVVSGGAGIAKSLNVGGFVSSKSAFITAGLASDQSITTGSDNLLLLTDKDDANNWWTGTAGSGVSHRFKPNIAGNYFVSLQVHFKAATGSGQINIQARKNTTTLMIAQDQVVAADGRTLNLSGVISLDGNTDYIEFSAYSSGTSQVITGDVSRSFTLATIYKLF